jgi:hypothetical protein
MSTSNQTPVLLSLTVVVTVAVVAGAIASKLLGYLATTAAGPQQLGYWVPLLGIGMPALVLLAIAIWVYSGR